MPEDYSLDHKKDLDTFHKSLSRKDRPIDSANPMRQNSAKNIMKSGLAY